MDNLNKTFVLALPEFQASCRFPCRLAGEWKVSDVDSICEFQIAGDSKGRLFKSSYQNFYPFQ